MHGKALRRVCYQNWVLPSAATLDGHLISGNAPVHGPYLSHNHWVSLKGTKKKKKQLMLVRLSISMSKKLVADLVINNF